MCSQQCSHTDECRLEEDLGAAEPLVADGDDLTVRQLVALLNRRRFAGHAQLLFEIHSCVTQLFLDVAYNLQLSCKKEKFRSHQVC